jgi:DNA-binding NtrC family response regulator
MTLPRPLLLVVDDDVEVLALIRRVAEAEGFAVITCTDGRKALEIAEGRRPDLVMVDLRMPDVAGLDVVRALRLADAKATIVLMTGYGSIDSAVEAVKLGAADYLTKPFDMARLKDMFAGVREQSERRAHILAVDREVARHVEFAGMIGRSQVMQEVFDLIRRMAPHVRTALVSGETGTGKELVARALHQCGPRRARRFVAVNCSAVVETLFESELFGHVRGAFTGAIDAKAGLFEAADGGTLFVDEIAELAPPLQAKLLRVLEDGSFRRVGSVTERRADVRVVAATNRDLAAEVAAGRFREDLYYRINVVTLRLPPLRDRTGDVPRLVNAFLGRDWQLDAEARHAVEGYRWPGNVRQLRNALERAKVLASRNVIRLCDLPTEVAFAACGVRSEPAGDDIESRQREHVLKVLARERGNKSRTARLLGLDRRSLYRLLERYAEEGTSGIAAAKPR